MPEINTDRLSLRPLSLDDIEWFAAMRGDENIMRYIGKVGAVPRAIAEERLERHLACWAERGFGMFGVRERGHETAVGWAGLQPLEGTDEIEVGYAFGKQAWGRGYATETAHAIVRWGFETLGLERIVAVAYAENTGSRRVMDKLGMTYEGMRHVHGTDSVYYTVTPDAFARAALPRATVG
ncbi:MAG: GNAT family N-acetyltransferase [Gemmatimonadota bacterium]|nr:GNAT family N-acetyltransferase [Gemmatimonadota bacterium]